VLDVGCGKADFFDFLIRRGVVPARYTGLEAQRWLARAARGKRRPAEASIVEADFVKQPAKLRVGADAIVFSGSLNLLSAARFYSTLEHAWSATRTWLAFNFLTSPALAADEYLMWRRRDSVVAFARRLGGVVRVDDGYEHGDCTIAMRKRRRRAGRLSARSRIGAARRG
jgi:hypothetical protein